MSQRPETEKIRKNSKLKNSAEKYFGVNGLTPYKSVCACNRNKRRQPEYRSHKSGFNSKVRIVINRKGRVINLKTKSWITAEHTVALGLTKTIKLVALFRDYSYDTNFIINYDEQFGIKIVIPPKFNQKFRRNLDSDLCCLHHILENTFLKFKRWHGIAVHYFKTSVAFRVFLFILFFSFSLLCNFCFLFNNLKKIFSLKKIFLFDKQKILFYH